MASSTGKNLARFRIMLTITVRNRPTPLTIVEEELLVRVINVQPTETIVHVSRTVMKYRGSPQEVTDHVFRVICLIPRWSNRFKGPTNSRKSPSRITDQVNGTFFLGTSRHNQPSSSLGPFRVPCSVPLLIKVRCRGQSQFRTGLAASVPRPGPPLPFRGRRLPWLPRRSFRRVIPFGLAQ